MQRRHRLRRAADFDLLRRKGKRWYHPLVVMVVRANNQQISKIGFSASRRIGKAVSRNRVKRLFREVIRRQVQDIEVGWDCLFIARSGAAEASYLELETAMTELLQRACMLDTDLIDSTQTR